MIRLATGDGADKVSRGPPTTAHSHATRPPKSRQGFFPFFEIGPVRSVQRVISRCNQAFAYDHNRSAVRAKSQNLRGFRERQPREVPQLDQPGAVRIMFRQSHERLVERQKVFTRFVGQDERLVELPTLQFATMFDASLAAGRLDENAAHRFGGGAEKVSPSFPFRRGGVLPHQSQVRLVDEGRGLQRLARSFAPSSRSAKLRNSSYTKGNNSARRLTSPASNRLRMRVTFSMDDRAASEDRLCRRLRGPGDPVRHRALLVFPSHPVVFQPEGKSTGVVSFEWPMSRGESRPPLPAIRHFIP